MYVTFLLLAKKIENKIIKKYFLIGVICFLDGEAYEFLVYFGC